VKCSAVLNSLLHMWEGPSMSQPEGQEQPISRDLTLCGASGQRLSCVASRKVALQAQERGDEYSLDFRRS
jgi:hypothetical protein